MTNNAIEWAGTGGDQRAGGLALLPVAREELRRHPVLYVGIFTAIALCALVVGILLPKKYVSTTTILVEESNIIGPLMEGRAVATGVVNRALIAREVAFSRKIMDQVLDAGGWLEDDPSPVQKEKLIEQITYRTSITNPRENLIQISYTDSDPRRAYIVTQRLANLVITESLQNKEQESREAYEFIESQVQQYHAKLTDAETKLEEYRGSNPDARPGIEADVNARIGELRRQVEGAKLDLIDLRSEETALQSQLTGENEVSAVQTRAGQIRLRLAELLAERDRLLLTYTDQHPDVVRAQHQIRDLEEDLRREEARREARMAGSSTAVEGAATLNPLYGELRSRLSEARSRSAAVASRMATGNDLLGQELARSQRIAKSESSLAELTRDYEVNRDLYQDLLKRRENARVSMNLDAEKRGLTFRIQEPAAIPLRPSGLRLLHVAGAGLGGALAMPLVLLFGVVKFDPRVRVPRRIEQEAGLPVLTTIPLYATSGKRRQFVRRVAVSAFLFLLVLVAYGAALFLKLTHTL